MLVCLQTTNLIQNRKTKRNLPSGVWFIKIINAPWDSCCLLRQSLLPPNISSPKKQYQLHHFSIHWTNLVYQMTIQLKKNTSLYLQLTRLHWVYRINQKAGSDRSKKHCTFSVRNRTRKVVNLHVYCSPRRVTKIIFSISYSKGKRR